MSFESMYVVKGKKQKQGGVEEPVYYWLQDVEHEHTWNIVIRHDAHEMLYCSCMKLELAGISCRHMFAVMKYANMKRIPNGCILRRWTIGAMENAMLNEDTILDQQDDATITGHEGNKCKRFGIGDPKFVIAKGAPKGKKQ